MRRFFNVGALLAVLALLLPALAVAQETTGSIAGVAVDPAGKPVSFATVSVRSDAGERTVTTDDEGRFLVGFLVPGTYTVSVTADGYGSLTDDGVRVNLGTRVSRRYVLQPTMEEAMTVEAPEEAPQPVISNLETTTSGANISAETAENIPLGRNISNVVFLAPNVKSGGGTGSANPSIGGSSGFENQYVFDGINVTNGGYGALGSFSNVYGSQGTGINFNFVKETQVITNGFAAEFGQATGGIVNIVTKSGSNEWEGSVYGNWTPTGTQGTFKIPNRTVPVAPILGVQRLDYGFDVGGPIVKDKLFFWLGANPSTTTTTRRAPDPSYGLYAEGPQDLTQDTLNYAGKLSLQINPDHRLDFSMFGDPSETNYSFNRGSSALRQDTKIRYTKLETGYSNWGLSYHGTITPKLLVEATVAHSKNTFEEKLTSLGDQWSVSDLAEGIVLGTGALTSGGIGYTEPNSESENTQYNVKFTSLVGNHEIRYGLGVEDIKYDFVTSYTGPTITSRGDDQIGGTADDQQTTTGVTYTRALDCRLIGDPNVVEFETITDMTDSDGNGLADAYERTLFPAACPGTTSAAIPVIYRVTRGQLSNPSRQTSSDYVFAFIQDTWSTTPNVHINFGLRYEKQKMTGNTLEYTFPHTWSPRIGVSWDHTHQGKSKLYGYWGRFFEKVPNDIAVRSLSEEIDIFREDFWDSNLTQFVAQGAGGGNRYVPGGSGTTQIVGGTKNSYTDGMSIGYERDLGRGWGLTAEWQHRKLGDALEDFANVPGSDIVLGTNTFGGYIIGNVPPSESEVPIDTSGGTIAPYVRYVDAERDYQSLTITGTHTGERFYYTAQYCLSNLHGNYEGLFRNDNGQSDPNITSLFDFPDEPMFGASFKNGDLNTNRTHRFQTFGYYSWRNGWTAGGRMVVQSGIPVLKLYSHPVYENGGEISFDRRGSLGTTPYEYNIDLNVGKEWHLPTKFESTVKLTLDIFNVLNRRYANNWDFEADEATGVVSCDPADPNCYQQIVNSVTTGPANPDYNVPLTYVNPRELRFGVEWKF